MEGWNTPTTAPVPRLSTATNTTTGNKRLNIPKPSESEVESMPMSTSTYATNFNLVCWIVRWVVQVLVEVEVEGTEYWVVKVQGPNLGIEFTANHPSNNHEPERTARNPTFTPPGTWTSMP